MGTFIKSYFTSTDTNAPVLPASSQPPETTDPPVVTPPSSTVYASDSFDRADGTPGSTTVGGHVWQQRASTWTIKGGVLDSGDTTAATPNDCWIDPGKTAGTITAKVLSSGAGTNGAVIFRRAAVGHTCWIFYGRSDTTLWTLAKRTAGDAFTAITATDARIYFTPGQEAKVVFDVDRIRCYVDGVLTHDVTDSTYGTQTGVGVGTRLATAANPARFDNFSFVA